MQVVRTSMIVFVGYLLLLFAPGILPFNFGFGGYVFLALCWFAGTLWLVWRVPSRVYPAIMSGIALAALLAWPISALYVGCYIFNECI